ncbi:hypothetical protein Taro_029583 [Colocasia esculenta]|uniref:Uncharacterized protein n=1 Tax=Colocasia esculenta TaxID=4460 RepID=A0A843VK75_COLES|nr:hypothetical protein [Colocasia esculenta]
MFLGAVHGGTDVCGSLTSWRVWGPGCFCLWGLDPVEVWDGGACVVRLWPHVVAPVFYELLVSAGACRGLLPHRVFGSMGGDATFGVPSGGPGVGFFVGLHICVGVSRRLREPTCGVAFTGAGLWSVEPRCDTCLWLLSALCWLVVNSGEVLPEFSLLALVDVRFHQSCVVLVCGCLRVSLSEAVVVLVDVFRYGWTIACSLLVCLWSRCLASVVGVQLAVPLVCALEALVTVWCVALSTYGGLLWRVLLVSLCCLDRWCNCVASCLVSVLVMAPCARARVTTRMIWVRSSGADRHCPACHGVLYMRVIAWFRVILMRLSFGLAKATAPVSRSCGLLWLVCHVFALMWVKVTCQLSHSPEFQGLKAQTLLSFFFFPFLLLCLLSEGGGSFSSSHSGGLGMEVSACSWLSVGVAWSEEEAANSKWMLAGGAPSLCSFILVVLGRILVSSGHDGLGRRDLVAMGWSSPSSSEGDTPVGVYACGPSTLWRSEVAVLVVRHSSHVVARCRSCFLSRRVRAEGCFRIVFDSAVSARFQLLWLVRDWLSLLSLVHEAHPPTFFK